jgi:hypothetical protein
MKKDPESDSEEGGENSFFEGIGKQETLGDIDFDDAFELSSNARGHKKMNDFNESSLDDKMFDQECSKHVKSIRLDFPFSPGKQ